MSQTRCSRWHFDPRGWIIGKQYVRASKVCIKIVGLTSTRFADTVAMESSNQMYRYCRTLVLTTELKQRHVVCLDLLRQGRTPLKGIARTKLNLACLTHDLTFLPRIIPAGDCWVFVNNHETKSQPRSGKCVSLAEGREKCQRMRQSNVCFWGFFFFFFFTFVASLL